MWYIEKDEMDAFQMQANALKPKAQKAVKKKKKKEKRTNDNLGLDVDGESVYFSAPVYKIHNRGGRIKPIRAPKIKKND